MRSRPDPGNAGDYEKMKPVFDRIYEALTPVYGENGRDLIPFFPLSVSGGEGRQVDAPSGRHRSGFLRDLSIMQYQLNGR